ncbi:MAG: carboxypeptidase-like regulatory domain-containing protein [Phaeodactylibacter sp.]|nr:carboxypeptidase-like regulatory domain-containing protein [Phaeodactylibacter sp.]MCB9266575.1 carboxypeptidase-like regulatory domain-containing protein [Lewinellaceae bacterium]MCB9288649.1 carboxypeptidase-like regulatory domain-containing protein [Lewinellaceae bacterium]
MKRRALIHLTLLIFTLNSSLSAQDLSRQRVSVNYRNTPLKEAIRDLESRYGLHFVYSEQFVSLSGRVSLNARKRPLTQVLDELFRHSGIEYRLMDNRVALRAGPAPPAEMISRTPEKLLTQTVRGSVIDEASRMPLVGANIQLLDSAPFLGASTDAEGKFELNKVPVGRRNFQVTYLGYEPVTIRDIIIISGKELVLEIELQESTTTLDEIVVTTAIDKMQPLNSMVTVSGRQFRVEEASRYPGSFQDPARMSRSFAGVSYVNDLENDLIIRGNSPTSLLWRLEGIEIPTPNHFHAIGNTGGAISMLNSNILTTSDFLTGAFPADYGNTISGVFDLKFRNGNTEKNEYTLSAGVLGLEAGIEGPLQKKKGSSYLLNYRYSTVAILEMLGLNPVVEGGVPKYQDLAFKVLFPTKKTGVFSLFGLGATNIIARSPELQGNGRFGTSYFDEEAARYGIAGLKHTLQLSSKAYLQTTIATAWDTYKYKYDFFSDSTEIPFSELVYYSRERHLTGTFRLSTQYNKKNNARTATQLGAVVSRQIYSYKYRFGNERTGQESTLLDDIGDATTLQAFGQWKRRLSDKMTFNHGLHLLYFSMNKALSLEPRLGLEWELNPRESLKLGAGIHSYIGHLSSYLYHSPFDFDIQPFRNRTLPKSLQFVLGYSLRLPDDWHIRPEIYYQHIFDAAVSSDPNLPWVSILNVLDNYDVFDSAEAPITNKGRGRNFGLELTAEKLFSQGYYCLFTASVYDSRYSTVDGRWFSTRFNGNYIFNLLGGREFTIRGNDRLGVNGKFIYAGGNRFSRINEEASKARGFEVINPNFINSEKAPDYYRADLLLSYTANNPRATHKFTLDIQNLFQRSNVLEYYFSPAANKVETAYQVRFLFDLRYRLVF